MTEPDRGDLAEELAALTQATHDLVATIIAPVAHAEAVRVARTFSATARLRRAKEWWRLVLGMTVAVMLSVALVDVHVHRSHIAPLEHGHVTSDAWPMWPTEYATGVAVGPVLLFVGAVVILVSVVGYVRASRRLAEQYRREGEDLERPLAEQLRTG